MAAATAAVYATVMTLLMALLSFLTYRRYARRDGSMGTMVIVVFAWTVSLSVAYLLPIDMYPDHAVFAGATTIWKIIYWFCFVSTWVLFPVQQGYETSGYFTFWSRMLDSLFQNLVFYVLAGVLGIAFYFILQLSKYESFLIVLSTFWGFSLYVMLLGYGLVELPREFWKASGQSFHRRALYYDAQKSWTAFEEAMDRIVESSKALKILQGRLEKEAVGGDISVLKKYSSVIEGIMPHELFKYHRAVNEESKFVNSMKECKLNVHAFAKVHERMKSDLIESRRNRAHFEEVYEKIDANSESDPEDFDDVSPIVVHAGPRDRAAQCFWKSVSVICGVLSVIVLFSELTLPVTADISPFGLLIHASDVYNNFFALQIVGCICVFYLCLCSFFGLFSLRLGKFYTLHPDQHSEEYSLLFNANYLIRLIFPLGFNFLHMVRDFNTSFQSALFSLDIVGDYQKLASYFFPFLVVLFSGITYFNLIGRLLRVMRISSFDPQVSGSVDIEIEEGKALIKREKRSREQKTKKPSTVDRRL